ncbi:MAG: hypothetical protein WA919_13830 [Coleofasciculaceae cyanobacterium]
MADYLLVFVAVTAFLYQKIMVKSPLRSVKGLCADLKVDITEEEIAEARTEMWGNIPRDII